MPPPRHDGEIDPSAVPDYVAVAGMREVVGYVSKDAVLGDAEDQAWPVYADDLRTVVGHMVPGRGFVPIGVDPASVPTFEIVVRPIDPAATPGDGKVIVYVRNGGSTEAWLAVLTAGEVQLGGAGFPADGYIGVWCGTVPLGSRVVIMDRSPVDPNATPIQTIQLGSSAKESTSRSIDVTSDGEITVKSGIPDWWTSGPPPC
jgi:hypothetical protein